MYAAVVPHRQHNLYVPAVAPLALTVNDRDVPEPELVTAVEATAAGDVVLGEEHDIATRNADGSALTVGMKEPLTVTAWFAAGGMAGGAMLEMAAARERHWEWRRTR